MVAFFILHLRIYLVGSNSTLSFTFILNQIAPR